MVSKGSFTWGVRMDRIVASALRPPITDTSYEIDELYSYDKQQTHHTSDVSSKYS